MWTGAFDISNKIVYHDTITYSAASKVTPAELAIGKKVRDWGNSLSKRGLDFKSTDQMKPNEKFLPFMISPKNGYCYKAFRGTSKGNTGNVHITLKYIRALLRAVPEISLDDIFIIVPYLEQRKLYMKIKSTMPEWASLQILTANKAQGHESAIVFFDGTVAENLKGKVGFVADKHRLAVYTTRHQHTLAVVMDRNAIVQLKGKKAKEVVEQTESAEVTEGEVRHEIDALEAMVDWFSKEDRIIEEDASLFDESIISQVTADNYDSKVATVNPDNFAGSGAPAGWQSSTPSRGGESTWDAKPAETTTTDAWNVSSDNNTTDVAEGNEFEPNPGWPSTEAVPDTNKFDAEAQNETDTGLEASGFVGKFPGESKKKGDQRWAASTKKSGQTSHKKGKRPHQEEWQASGTKEQTTNRDQPAENATVDEWKPEPYSSQNTATTSEDWDISTTFNHGWDSTPFKDKSGKDDLSTNVVTPTKNPSSNSVQSPKKAWAGWNNEQELKKKQKEKSTIVQSEKSPDLRSVGQSNHPENMQPSTFTGNQFGSSNVFGQQTNTRQDQNYANIQHLGAPMPNHQQSGYSSQNYGGNNFIPQQPMQFGGQNFNQPPPMQFGGYPPSPNMYPPWMQTPGHVATSFPNSYYTPPVPNFIQQPFMQGGSYGPITGYNQQPGVQQQAGQVFNQHQGFPQQAGTFNNGAFQQGSMPNQGNQT